MKQKSVLTTLIVCTLIVCMFFVVFIIKNYSTKENLKENNYKKTTFSYNSGYLLSEYDGKLATFNVGSDNPIEVFDVYVSSLPQKDKEEIQKGIYANNEDDLQRLIEDFTS